MKMRENNFYILIRYLILFLLMFSLPLINKILTPLTINFSAFLLGIFYGITTINDIIIIEPRTFIQIIPACVAGSAYLLLLIINLTTPMSYKNRYKTVFLSFIMLFIINILRIALLAILYHNNIPFFDFTHKFFWYALSTIFVISIWFFIVKIFSIKQIPIYTDFKYLLKNIKYVH